MAGRQIKTPGVAESQQPETNEEIKTEQPTETITEQVATESQPTEPSQGDLLRELAEAKAQIEQLKNQSQQVSTGVQQPANAGGRLKRVPVLTKDGWTTKEAD